MELAQGSLLPPGLHLCLCSLDTCIAFITLKVFVFGSKKEGLCGQVNNVAKATNSVGSIVIIDGVILCQL